MEGWQKRLIFLSYRRDDAPFAVGLLAAMLFDRFPPDTIFLDTIANRRGLFAASRLSRALGRSVAVLCVIGSEWDDESHVSRLADESDFVRWELETALSQDVPVIPVFVDLIESWLPVFRPGSSRCASSSRADCARKASLRTPAR